MDKKVSENTISGYIKKYLDEMNGKEFILCVPLRKEVTNDGKKVRS